MASKMLSEVSMLAVIVSIMMVPTVTSSPHALKDSSIHHQNARTKGLDPEVFMDATQLITSKGFPCDNHYVTTDDGYILNLLRIPHGRRSMDTPKGNRPVVLLQHGLLGTCTNYLTNLVNQSLAYLLADAGADVWLGNSRGSLYSINHTTLSPKQEAFWRFTWDEMAKYDLPATVEYILQNTGVESIYYVGHSQGTIIGFAGFSQNLKLASRIKHFMALAPVAKVANIKTGIAKLAPLANIFSDFVKFFGHGQFRVEPKAVRVLKGALCQKLGATICKNLMFLTRGYDSVSTNKSRIPVYESHSPGGTSVENILHWAQEVNSKEFQMFDFGSEKKNMEHYGQPTPPLYDPRKMSVPVAVFRGGKDRLADVPDTNWLISELPNVTSDVYIPHYTHLDFILAIDSPHYIYNHILRIVGLLEG